MARDLNALITQETEAAMAAAELSRLEAEQIKNNTVIGNKVTFTALMSSSVSDVPAPLLQ